MTEPNELAATIARLASAAEALEHTAAALQVNHEAITSKIDRLVAAIDEGEPTSRQQLEARVAELERANADLKAQAGRLSESAARKTLPPLVTALLSKNSVEADGRIDVAVLDKTLATLPVDQRIAVKAQMARAGLIE